MGNCEAKPIKGYITFAHIHETNAFKTLMKIKRAKLNSPPQIQTCTSKRDDLAQTALTAKHHRYFHKRKWCAPVSVGSQRHKDTIGIQCCWVKTQTPFGKKEKPPLNDFTGLCTVSTTHQIQYFSIK